MSRIEIIESNADYERALREIEKVNSISYDVETSGLSPFKAGAYLSSLGIGTQTKDFTFPLNHYKGKLYEDFKGQKKRILQINEVIKKKKKAAHNGKFDCLFTSVLFGVWWPIDFDTMLAHYNLNENELHDLETLTIKYLDGKAYDIPLEWKHGIAGTLEDHCEYLGQDLYSVTRLKRIFTRMLEEEPTTNMVFRHLTMPASTLYTRIEKRGVPIHQKKLADGHKYWEEIAVRTDKEITKASKGFTPTANKKGKVPELKLSSSPKQLADFLFKHCKIKPIDKTPTGAPAVNESVLKRIEHPIAKIILDNREANKNLSTFIDNWTERLDREGRIHPTFKIHGTVTGRPACENPNLQFTPRDPRIRAIIDSTDDEWVLAEFDYSQAELRIVADVANEKTLLQIYKEGGDVHTNTVQKIFGIDKPTPEERKKGKAINFGFIYGMWWKKFIIYARDNYNQVFQPKEAERTRTGFFEEYSDLPPWHNRQKKLARTQGYVMNKLGRKRRLPDAMRPYTGNYDPKLAEAERQSINSPIQSMASDMLILAAVEIDNTIPEEDAYIIGTVHDSMLVMIRKVMLHKVAPKIKAIMEDSKVLRDVFQVKFKVPIIAECKVGPWSLGKEYDFKNKCLKEK